MIIIGHNYANGPHFGKPDRLSNGDSVKFHAPDEKKYSYLVYEIDTVTPDNIAPLDKYAGDYALTLVTCANFGNHRFIVRFNSSACPLLVKKKER